MRILGVDPGTVNMGWGVIESDNAQTAYVNCGILKQQSGSEMGGRLLFFYEELLKIIEKYHPAVCAVESPFVGENIRSAFVLGKAQGIAILAAAAKGLRVVEYPPNLVKQRLSGYGHSSKEQMQTMLALLLNMENLPKQTDATDALAIALCHHMQEQINGLMPEGTTAK